MSVTLNLPQYGMDYRSHSRAHRADRSTAYSHNPSEELVIGLLNNMSDGALTATERQFVSLLNSASGDFSIRLSLYYFPGIPRSKSAAGHLDRYYASLESLWDAKLDGLIVTGREPLSPCLQDEPYWNNFVRVLEWARENTYSTIWSCLAAHAAVLHMDGIQRQRNERKHCGVFDCVVVSEHPLTADLPARFRLPHSRWHGLREIELTRSGYQILTQADDAGVDSFVKQDRSLFVFFQGHPEYMPDTLFREYRRDVDRYLRGEGKTYPTIPEGHFDSKTLSELMDIEREAVKKPREQTLTLLATIASSVGNRDGWCATATTLYRNWLEEVYERKMSRQQSTHTAINRDIPAIPHTMRSAQVEPGGVTPQGKTHCVNDQSRPGGFGRQYLI